MTRTERQKLRQAVADYMYSEGCSCCRSSDHDEHRARLAKLLGIKPKDDWHDFSPYRSHANGRGG